MSDEIEIKNFIRPILQKNFEVREEVEGNFLVDGTRVRIDFLLYPKRELLVKGFDEEWIGLEVKSPNTNESKKRIIGSMAGYYLFPIHFRKYPPNVCSNTSTIRRVFPKVKGA